MIYKIERVQRDVRIALDENMSNDRLMLEDNPETLSINDIVHSKIVDGVCAVVCEAPFHLLDNGVVFGETVFWRDKACGLIPLPDDFLRLIIFKMSDWERPVYEAITFNDPRYSLQFSRYKGIRGNSQKPIVAIVRRAEGLALELFSCKDCTATIDHAVYYPCPQIDKQGGIEIPERCYKSAIYMISALVAMTIKEFELSNKLSETSKNALL